MTSDLRALRPSRLLVGAALLPVTLLALTACSGPGGAANAGTGPTAVSGTAGPAGLSTATVRAIADSSPSRSAKVPVDTAATHAPAALSTAVIRNPADGQGLDFGFITKVTRSGGTLTITLDRATYVNDPNADDDYRVVDDNKKLRTFIVDPAAGVLMLTTPGYSSELSRVSVSQFVAKADAELKANNEPPVWLRHTSGMTGEVTALTEQYMP